MLENLDMTSGLGKREYEDSLEGIHREIGLLQRQLREKGIPVIILVEGWEASGKGYVMGEMIRPLDPRGFVVIDEGEEDPSVGLFPPFRRFWSMVPEKGKILFLNRSWYRLSMESGMKAYRGEEGKENFLERAKAFERNLYEEGVRILKLFLHVSSSEQKERIKALEENPSTKWRVARQDLQEIRDYKTRKREWEEILNRSDFPFASWVCLPSEDLQIAAKRALETVASFLRNSLHEAEKDERHEYIESKESATGLLGRIDLGKTLSGRDYKEELPRLQKMLLERQYELYKEGRSLVVVFEGWDAAGKGGAIKRLTQRLDPRGYEVHPISAPNDWERAHPYLWRFWLSLPRKGHIGIFDRSWYGRVLVERVEKLCGTGDWRRAFTEINEMESEWVEHGVGIVKFWIHIDKEEQLKRFNEREQTEYKRWKITAEDWRNREKWEKYEEAVEEMLLRTSTPWAPWTIVEGNDKHFARIKVIEGVLARIEEHL
jgi:polyphosphate:AMP phosphotransferase